MDFADQINRMRERMTHNHDASFRLLEDLSANLYQQDAALRGKVQEIIDEHHERKADIVRSLELLANMIGRFPTVETAQTVPPPLRRVNGHLGIHAQH